MNGLFSPLVMNWPDLREFEIQADKLGRVPFTTAWCHGAPGIGLARLCMLRRINDNDIRSEIEPC